MARSLPLEIRTYSGGIELILPEFVCTNLTSPGQKDGLARKYAHELGLTSGGRSSKGTGKISRELASELLEPYGAWSLAEMSAWQERKVIETLLWVAAGNEPISEPEDKDGYTVVSRYIGD